MEPTRSGRDAAPRAAKVWAGKVLVLALLLTGLGCAASRPVVEQATELPFKTTGTARAVAPTPPEETPPTSYVVQPGDTLWRIAATLRTSVEDLARANDISDPSRLLAGMSLRIPASGTSRVPEAGAFRAPSTILSWPVRRGRILSRYGDERKHRAHRGLDIGGQSGAPVLAAEAGRVVYSGSSMRGYGKTVILDHGGRLQTLYAHNAELLVRVGEIVARGQAVALLGRSGNASADHCHFEVRNNHATVDPMRYLPDLAELR